MSATAATDRKWPADLAVTVRDQGKEQRNPRTGEGKLANPQQRFEESHVGKVMISAFVAVFVLIGVLWNVPDSPIRRSLIPVLTPVAAPAGLDQYWGMYGTPDSRLETVEVHVKMANGEDRVWAMQPGERGIGWWDRWILLRRAVIHDASIRPQLARWVVREVTEPTEHVVGVTVVYRTQTLPPPGEGPPGKPAMKVLYQEALAGAQ